LTDTEFDGSHLVSVSDYVFLSTAAAAIGRAPILARISGQRKLPFILMRLLSGA
jgi:hypothetical protein